MSRHRHRCHTHIPRIDITSHAARPARVRLTVASVVALLATMAVSASASPVAVDTIVRDRISAALPEDLGVVDVFLPSSLASLATEPDRVTIEMPRALNAGRSSAKVLVRGRASVYVPFSISKRLEVMVVRRAVPAGTAITADDVTVERRAVAAAALPSTIVGSSATRDLAVGNVIAKSDVTLSPPLARGTQISIEMRKGRVTVRGVGVLEAAARNGETTSARLAQTRVVVRGTLRAQTLFVGEN